MVDVAVTALAVIPNPQEQALAKRPAPEQSDA
jgi:hypothetical protein